MSRYTGPRVRVLRALDTDLPGLTRKSRERRPQRPGQHGMARRRRPSEYAMQLLEKQKLRFNYGLTERQLRRLYKEAHNAKGITGNVMVSMLERRLDNVVFRLGICPTIPAARQLVNHRHVLLNGRRVDIPSIRTKQGDVIALTERARKFQYVVESLASPAVGLPQWLRWTDGNAEAHVVAVPTIHDALLEVDTQLIVEFYAR
ncbi:MAG: 30S ribosomal protein S4 [Deltaproteobacteria bacterium]|nr:30S ribosomal protein S4 [Deltaproteobacteria bacterium]